MEHIQNDDMVCFFMVVCVQKYPLSSGNTNTKPTVEWGQGSQNNIR